MKMPLGLAYPALLGCYSILPDSDTMLDMRINLYVALIAHVGGGKNVAIGAGSEDAWSRQDGRSVGKAGRLPSFRIGTSVRFCPKAVADWLREQWRKVT